MYFKCDAYETFKILRSLGINVSFQVLLTLQKKLEPCPKTQQKM